MPITIVHRRKGTGLGPDARDFGARGDAVLLSDAAMTVGLPTLTTSVPLTPAHVGMRAEVGGAGPEDAFTPLPHGRRSLLGFVGSIGAGGPPSTCTLVDAGGAPLVAQATVTGAWGTLYHPDTSALADWSAASTAGGGLPMTLVAGTYVITGPLRLGSGSALYGAGAGVTFLRAAIDPSSGLGPTALIIDGADRVQVRGITILGYGADGGPSGAAFQGGVQVSNSTHVLLEDVEVRRSHIGFTVRDQGTDHVTLRNCAARDIVSSNGREDAAAGAAIGFWWFNGPRHVSAWDCLAERTMRHGFYADPGTSSGAGATLPENHAPIDYLQGGGWRAVDTCRMGIGVAIGLQGVRWGRLANLQVETVGRRASDGAWQECEGLYLGADQNGEYSYDTEVDGYTLKDVGGIAVHLTSAVRCRLRGGKVDDWNRAQLFPRAPVIVESYAGFTATNVLAGPDNDGSQVELDVDGYTGSAANYPVFANFQGGVAVPDGAGGTRTARTVRNQVRGRAANGSVKPQTGLGTFGGGAASCPSEGGEANVVLEGPLADQTGSAVFQARVQGEAASRFRQLASGRMEWGGGATTYDAVLYRNSTGVLKTDGLLYQAGEVLTKTGSFSVSGTADVGRTFLIATTANQVATLPAVAAANLGMRVRFILAASALSAGTGFQVAPNAADKIMGAGIAALDAKRLINTGASDAEGDLVELQSDGVDGWYIVNMRGTWAREA